MARLEPSLYASLCPVHRSWIWMGKAVCTIGGNPICMAAVAETLAVTREERMDDALQRARRVYAALDQG